MPPDVRGRPPGRPDDRPNLITAAAPTAKLGQTSSPIVRQGDDHGQAPQRRRWLPIASASLYEPDATRSWWWLSIRCPHCGSVHLGRVREEQDAPGPRRASCGRRVLVVVRRTYRGRHWEAA